MQEPIEPKEPELRLVEYEVSDFDSNEFNNLNRLEEQLAYIECCKKEYCIWNKNTIYFKLELNEYSKDSRFTLNAYMPESEKSYQNSFLIYQKQLVNYKEQLKEYKVYKKQLYLKLKEELYLKLKEEFDV